MGKEGDGGHLDQWECFLGAGGWAAWYREGDLTDLAPSPAGWVTWAERFGHFLFLIPRESDRLSSSPIGWGLWDGTSPDM
jgi:hypothetical protein